MQASDGQLTALASRTVTWRSVTANSPQAAVSCRMESRVTPGRMVPSNGGVASSLYADLLK